MVMDKSECIAAIRRVFARHGVVLRAEIFGSVARGMAGPASDVDLIVSYQDTASIYDESALRTDLEAALGVPVSLVDAEIVERPRSPAHKLFADAVKADREVVYERPS